MKLSETMTKALFEAAEGKNILSQRTREALRKRGLLDEKGEITPEGVTAYEQVGGKCVDVHFLTLGTPVSLPTKQGKMTLRVGSRLRIIFRENIGRALYYSCYIGDNLPVVYVGQNRAHKFETLRIPENHPLKIEFAS